MQNLLNDKYEYFSYATTDEKHKALIFRIDKRDRVFMYIMLTISYGNQLR